MITLIEQRERSRFLELVEEVMLIFLLRCNPWWMPSSPKALT